jgi:hypothetical protein
MPPDSSPAPPSDDPSAVYVYAVVPDRPSAPDTAGIEDRPVEVLPRGPFAAVVSRVDPSDWTGDAGDEHMQDLAWVGPRAYRHEQVVEAVMQGGDPVYPARFGTLFTTPERLAAALEAHEDALRSFFGRVEGAAEWAVKGLLDRDAAAAAETEAGAAESGTAYLQRRKQEQEARASVDAWVEEVAEQLFDPLAAHAADARVLPVPGDAGRDQEVVFNWAFLVPDAQVEPFRAEAEREREEHASRGLSLDLTGPWPPYNFRPSLDDTEA